MKEPVASTSNAGRRSRDGAETRARIEGAALRLFSEKGVAGTSVRDIAQAVGVSEGALYRHFPSKEALARDLFVGRYAGLAAEICSIDDSLANAQEKLRAVVLLACRMFDREPALFAYLLINQHDHLHHVPEDPERNVVEAVVRMMRGVGLAPEQAALAAAMALGCVVQPAVFTLYGRLKGELALRAEDIAQAVIAIVEGIAAAE